MKTYKWGGSKGILEKGSLYLNSIGQKGLNQKKKEARNPCRTAQRPYSESEQVRYKELKENSM